MDDPIKEPLINFPCHFAIKVIGDAVEDFSDIVLKSISKFDARFDSSCIEMKGTFRIKSHKVCFINGFEY